MAKPEYRICPICDSMDKKTRKNSEKYQCANGHIWTYCKGHGLTNPHQDGTGMEYGPKYQYIRTCECINHRDIVIEKERMHWLMKEQSVIFLQADYRENSNPYYRILKATDKESALKEADDYLRRMFGYNIPGATIFMVKEITDVPVQRWYAEKNAEYKAENEAKEKQNRRRQYDLLKQEFDGEKKDA